MDILLALALLQSEPGPFLRKHCVSCHGAEKQKSGLRLDRIDGFRPGESHLWTQVHRQVSGGGMPPADRPRPSEAERRELLAWIEKEQRAQRPGGVRRLNRRELSAALRDLTGLSVDHASALPGDGTVDGFDVGAEALQDAADSVDRGLEIARRAVQGIRFLDAPSGKTLAIDFRKEKDPRKALDAWKIQGVVMGERGNALPGRGLLLEPRWLGDRGGFQFFVPAPPGRRGILRLAVSLAPLRTLAGMPAPQLWVRIGGNAIDTREISGPAELVYEVQLDDLAVDTKGISVSLSAYVEVPYAIPGFENEERGKPGEEIPGGTGLFRPAFDRKKLPPEQQPVPYLLLERLEIDLDRVAAWPPPAWKADVGPLRDDPACASALIRLWIDRAHRRPPEEAELAEAAAFYGRLRGQGLPFDAALRAVFQSVLLGGPFRYLAPTADRDPAAAQHAIASRLGFLLAGGPPDAELRRLAAAGRLRTPSVLDAQVDRLLSGAFVRPFTTQWLELGQPITVAMDHLQKQDFRFARHLKESMTGETLAYVEELFASNRPAREAISSDWTMMNGILARHYGTAGIEGARFRKVALRPDDPRGGGIAAHAGIQSMLCWMGDNWVIYRGAWALRHLLDAPPPPPPLDVPELNAEEHRGRSFREILQRHQADPKCAVCHDRIDPLGFAFQNFDLSGRWRDVEHERYEKKELDGKIEWRGAGRSRPVDAVGRLPRGEEFRSFAEWKARVVGNYERDFVRGLSRNLLLYATGRRPDVADLAEIEAVLKDLGPKGTPLRDLLKALLRTRAFLGHE
jgi:hypothetical protein